jgi:protocatechuate 3,4-dioxygenase, alpha subunit
MSSEIKRIPSSSQTVGPYFRIGLDYLIDRMAADAETHQTIEIGGRVLDRDGAPLPDAMLEFWSAGDGAREIADGVRESGIPDRFRRAGTDSNGSYVLKIRRPVASRLEDGRLQAPHVMVLVFARGLMRHLITRVYLEDETGIESDPVLLGVPAERRGTLLAKCDGANVYRWDVILQGADETVFFAW